MTIDYSSMSVEQLAQSICSALKRAEITAVLVGGTCVSIYSDNAYQSKDLDFVCYEELKRIEEVLKPLGFVRQGRQFTHSSCDYIVDFVNPPISVGRSPVTDFAEMESSFGCLQLLTPTDCVKDRFASFVHWGDQQALEQALLVARAQPLDFGALRRRARTEGCEKQLEEFLSKIAG